MTTEPKLPVVFHANAQKPPDHWLNLPKILQNEHTGWLIETRLTPTEFASLAGDGVDILPYIGYWQNQDEGGFHFDYNYAYEFLDDAAFTYNDATGEPWEPISLAEFKASPQLIGEFLNCIIAYLESEDEDFITTIEQFGPERIMVQNP